MRETRSMKPLAAAICASVATMLVLAACASAKHTGARESNVPSASAGSVSPALTGGTPTASPSLSENATPTPSPSDVALQSVNWSAVNYPTSCGQKPGVRILQVAYAKPEAGKTIALVLLNCNFGAGTPPSALLTYDHASSSTTPLLAQTLLTLNDGWIAGTANTAAALVVEGRTVSVAVSGYPGQGFGGASPGPTVKANLTWTWEAGEYHETSVEPPHAQLPSGS